MKFTIFFTVFLFFYFSFSQTKIKIEGVIYDEYENPIPYGSIGITSKNIGTSSTLEGNFSFYISKNELSDILEISSIGYYTFKILISDYLDNVEKKIILKEKITELGEVVIETPKEIVKKALKSQKKNTVNDKHKLGMLYRRWSVEDNLCRFFIEQYIDVLDKGPSSYILDYNILHSRTSSDYRFIKNNQDRHAIEYMELNNPLRKGIALNAFNWQKIKDTNYEDEDVLVIKGLAKNNDYITLYIGFDSYKIYRLEMGKTPEIGKALSAIYTYRNSNKNKLYLSYHSRQWEGSVKTPQNVKKNSLNFKKKVREYIPIAYRHEVFVINYDGVFKKSNLKSEFIRQDMTLYKRPYNKVFWKNLSIPPETEFYKKNISELENLFNVPISKQFEFSSKN